MTLADLRRVSVKSNLRIRFPLSNGMECVLNEHGIAQVPALRAVPEFNLERELAEATEFVVEEATSEDKEKAKAKPRRYNREEMSALAKAGPGGPCNARRPRRITQSCAIRRGRFPPSWRTLCTRALPV